MAQRFETFKAPTFDEALRLMRRKLGSGAVVVHTSEEREGGLFGFMGRRVVSLTAAVSDGVMPRPPRPLSVPEQRYREASGVGSDKNVERSVAYFQELLRQASREQTKGASGPPTPSPAVEAPQRGGSVRASRSDLETPATPRADSGPAVLPFRHGGANGGAPDLREEVREMRNMVELLMAEPHTAGLPRELAPHYRTLIDRGVRRQTAAALMGILIRETDLRSLNDPRVVEERLKLKMREQIKVTGGVRLTPGGCRVVSFVGPTGVGKTTNLAKLAALFASVKGHARVALITADTYRVAAPEQLRVYANIIGLPMKVVNTPEEMDAAVRALRNHDLILIDTAGSSQFNVKQLQELKGILAAAQSDETMLVLSANTQADDMSSVVANFNCVKPTSLFFTKLDETRRFGEMFSLLTQAKLPLSYLSIGQNVPDDIVLAHSGIVANLVLEGRDKRGRSSTKSA